MNLMKEELSFLYKEKQLTAHEIAEIYNCDKQTVIKYLIDFDIDKSPKQRKFEIIKKVPLNNEQKQMIVGSIIGNGKIERHGESFRFSSKQKANKKNFLVWQRIVLGNLVNNIQKRVKKDKEYYLFNTTISNEYKFYYSLFYENNKKVIKDELIHYFTPLSLSTLIMDKGVMNNEFNLRIITNEFSLEENKKLQFMLKTNFDIRSKICTYMRNNIEYNYLSINKENTIKSSILTEKYFKELSKYNSFGPSTTTCQTLENTKSNDDIV